MSKTNKSILVIDTPTCCEECKLNHSFKSDEIKWCGYTHFGRSIFEKNKRPDWCPLSPLPEKKDLKQYVEKEKQNIENGDCCLDNVLAYQYSQGYNSCLDDILKGNKNEKTN